MKPSATIAVCAALLAAACASPSYVRIPDALAPAANESLAMTVAAKGVQVYECRARKDASGFEWAFVAPEAELFDEHGRPVGRHGAGPVWQANDGSRIVGTLKARADAPDAGAIAWLLLTTKSNGPAGSFSRVTSIQRVNTVGGLAPATPCTPGIAARVGYTADYRLFAVR